MVQRKGNLPVKDSRSSVERAQEDLDIMTSRSMVSIPTASPALGDLPPYSAEGSAEGKWAWTDLFVSDHQGTKFSAGQAPTGAGQYPLQKFPVGAGPES